ncbi:MAG: hypothetical protein ACXWMK_09880 [Syntrophales bacterium]
MKKIDGLSGPLMALIAILVVAFGVNAALSDVDIDYSHNVAGTGTVMTDFKMGSSENTVAIGEVHGTGDVTDKYLFQSNDSGNVTILDQFLFTKVPAYNNITIRDYPLLNNTSGDLRLQGTIWAGKINLVPQQRFIK